MSAQSNPLNAPTWMITFSDLLMLLLAFFVLRYAMMSPKADPAPGVTQRQAAIWEGQRADLTRALNDILKTVPRLPVGTGVTIEEGSGATEIAAKVQIDDCFSEHEVNEPTFRCVQAMRSLASYAASSSLKVVLSAVAVSAEQSAGLSDWEVSARQTAIVARQFLDAGVPTKMLSVAPKGVFLTSFVQPTASNPHQNSRIELVFQTVPRENKSSAVSVDDSRSRATQS